MLSVSSVMDFMSGSASQELLILPACVICTTNLLSLTVKQNHIIQSSCVVTQECSPGREGDRRKVFSPKSYSVFRWRCNLKISFQKKKELEFLLSHFSVKAVLCWRNPWKSIEGRVARWTTGVLASHFWYCSLFSCSPYDQSSVYWLEVQRLDLLKV